MLAEIIDEADYCSDVEDEHGGLASALDTVFREIRNGLNGHLSDFWQIAIARYCANIFGFPTSSACRQRTRLKRCAMTSMSVSNVSFSFVLIFEHSLWK